MTKNKVRKRIILVLLATFIKTVIICFVVLIFKQNKVAAILITEGLLFVTTLSMSIFTEANEIEEEEYSNLTLFSIILSTGFNLMLTIALLIYIKNKWSKQIEKQENS